MQRTPHRTTRMPWRLLYAREDGQVREHRTLGALGASGYHNRQLAPMVPLPAGATLTLLPGCRPLGWDGYQPVAMTEPDVMAVAALLPTGYTRALLPAYETATGSPHLPLFGYTAVAGFHGKYFVPALALDPCPAWDPLLYNTDELPGMTEERMVAAPGNRLLAHHAHCATDYGCLTAQNVFYRRWEMGIAVSVTCNAQCVGCISEQLGDVPTPHDRIRFTPTVDEIVELALPHLLEADEPIVSFGQGCEGEPLLRAPLIARAIARLRQATDRGQIHINTNGSSPRAFELLCRAGLDSVRVSMFSAIDVNHDRYYGPRHYTLDDLERTLLVAERFGVHRSVNLLLYPGFQDCPGETEALIGFLERSQVQTLQLRNLNMDRELLAEQVGFPDEPPAGIEGLIDTFRSRLPDMRLASHTPYAGTRRGMAVMA